MMPSLLGVSRLLPIAVLALAVSCAGGKKTETSEDGASGSLFKKALRKTVGVTTYVVASREVPLVITEDGKAEASDRYQAKAPGNVKVQRVFVEQGARVQPGDPLVKFNDETVALRLNLARAEVREAEAGLAAFGQPEAKRETPQPEEQAEEGSEPPAEVAPNEARNQLYQAQLERARAELELYERVTELEQLNSPIAGTVDKVEVGEGGSAAEDQVLLEVVKLDPINFTFQVAPENVSYLERGSDIVIKFAAFPGQEFAGEVASMGTEAGSGNGGVDVRLRIANPDLTLKSDLKGTVEIRTSGRRKVVTVPEAAVVRSERSAYIYKLNGEKAQRVAVDTGTANGGQIEIEKGLVDGDTIIVSAEEGMNSLSDGATVEVQSTRAER